MKRSTPLQLNEIIQRMIDDTGMRNSYERRTVESLWPQIVGQSIAQYTRRVWLDEQGVFHVEIRSAALKEELGYMRENLVNHLNTAYGAEKVKAVVIH